jgi:hypothetical protein
MHDRAMHESSDTASWQEAELPVTNGWKARRHIKVRLLDGGFLLERYEGESCSVDELGLATCGRIACPSCGRGSANLSAWQVVALAPDEIVTCDCGHVRAASEAPSPVGTRHVIPLILVRDAMKIFPTGRRVVIAVDGVSLEVGHLRGA